VEKYLDKMKETGGTINEMYLSPNIVWRIQQVIESEEINKKIEADLENERDERKKKNIQTYSNKKSKIVDI
jgi:capsular polysaccharide biosynthesis protein